MGRQKRQQRRQQRQRRRRTRPTFQPVGSVRLPGIMGWFQNNPRIFYVGGIAIMFLSLGAVFFGTRGGARTAPTDTPTEQTEDVGADEEVTDTSTPEPAETAEAEATEEPIQRVYAAPPPFEIDPSSRYEAVIRTEKGEIRLELLPGDAPGYVNNFIFLARNRFYDGLTFHRVVPGFVAQAGDPTGSGFEGAGYDLPEERNSVPFDAGVISMAKRGATVDGAQFFITLEPQPALADGFTVFGRVVEGLDVLRSLSARDPGQADQPGDRILSIEIVEESAGGDS